MARDYRKWFEANIQGVEWTVGIGDPEVIKNIDGDQEGTCVPQYATILISSKLARKRFPDVAFHELVHALLGACGLSNSLLEVLGLDSSDGDLRERLEEAIVNGLAPVLYDTLQRNGMLRLPPLPKAKK